MAISRMSRADDQRPSCCGDGAVKGLALAQADDVRSLSPEFREVPTDGLGDMRRCEGGVMFLWCALKPSFASAPARSTMRRTQR
jgi:hypothetical protein